MADPITSLYDQVVDITNEYLGPPAERFVSRQIRSHLQKDPVQLTVKDLRALIDWIGLGMAFLTSDQLIIDSYLSQLKVLMHHQSPKPKKKTSHAT